MIAKDEEEVNYNTVLYSFDLTLFMVFMLAFYVIPYPLYRIIAHRNQWETNKKTISRHCNDFSNGISYGLILFTFGNYTNTLGWTTIMAFYPSLIIYALIAELEVTKTSLPNIKTWPKEMEIIFAIALFIVSIFAGYHVYLGSLLPPPFLIYYVSALLIPISILAISFALSHEVNTNWLNTRLNAFKSKKQAGQDEQERLLSQAHNPYNCKLHIHIHHWQIFYVLAFFTRFDNIISQIGAGICLACYMEGICAYGYDALMND